MEGGDAKMTSEYQSFLAHHGVKGQQWGRRRYQNLDGSLTPEGRKHYGIGPPESDTWRKDEAKWLSDEELNRRNSRMQREQQYRQGIDNRHPARQEIKKMAKTILIGTAAATLATIVRTKYSSKVWPKIGSLLSKVGKKSVDAIKSTKIFKTARSQIFARSLKNELVKYDEAVRRARPIYWRG